MSARVGFTASDAERQAADSVANYLRQALRVLAEATGLEKTLANHPDCFADRYAPLLASLIDAQASEYQSWVLFDRIGEVARLTRDGFEDVANVVSGRLSSLDESTLSGLADIAERLDDQNAGLCNNCKATRGRP